MKKIRYILLSAVCCTAICGASVSMSACGRKAAEYTIVTETAPKIVTKADITTAESTTETETETTTEETSAEETTEEITEEITTAETTVEETTAETVPETTAAPETAAPETAAPETAAPETAAPTAAPETAAPAVITSVGNIHSLSQAEIDTIRASFSTATVGYGGFGYWTAASAYQAALQGAGASNVRFRTNGGHVIALTFQEGWENNYTGQLLDILNAHGVKGCFYVTHSYANSRPDLIQRMINEGHVVGSHTYSCPDIPMANYPLETIMSDAMQMQQYMQDTFGYTMTDYNFNSGVYSDAACKMLSDMGYRVVMCSNSYSDYNASAAIDAASVLAQMEAEMADGAIYAFHVTNPATVQIIGPLIEYAQANGYQIVTVQ